MSQSSVNNSRKGVKSEHQSPVGSSFHVDPANSQTEATTQPDCAAGSDHHHTNETGQKIHSEIFISDIKNKGDADSRSGERDTHKDPVTSVSITESKAKRRHSLALRKQNPLSFTLGSAESALDSSYLTKLEDEAMVICSKSEEPRMHVSHASRQSSRSSRPSLACGRRCSFLRSTCLHPKFSLQVQLMLSFGFVSVAMLSFVTVVCVAVAILSGQSVKNSTFDTFDELALRVKGTTGRYMAEFLTHKLIPKDLVEIIRETTRDRIVGYPDAPGFAEDAYVPFFDVDSGKNRYPIISQPLPLDWQLRRYRNVNESNQFEHTQNRWIWHTSDRGDLGLSTQSASYHMQGTCNPAAKLRSDLKAILL